MPAFAGMMQDVKPLSFQLKLESRSSADKKIPPIIKKIPKIFIYGWALVIGQYAVVVKL